MHDLNRAAMALLASLVILLCPSFARADAMEIPGCPVSAFDPLSVRADLTGRFELTPHLVEFRYADEVTLEALLDDWRPEAWLDEQAQA